MAPTDGRRRSRGLALAGLTPVLQRLDLVLGAAVAADGRAPDDLRGAYLSRATAGELVDAGAGPGPRRRLVVPDEQPTGSPFATVRARFGLSSVELDLLALALAPDLDSRYGRLFGFLQDDLTRRRTTVGLAGRLLGLPADERLALGGLLGPAGRLADGGLLVTGAAPGDARPPLPDRELVVPDRVAGFLTGSDALDPAHRDVVTAVRPDVGVADLVLADDVRRHLSAVAAGPDRLVWLHGADGSGRPTAAQALARAWGSPWLLLVDARRLPVDEPDRAAEVVRSVRREARLRDATVCWEGADVLFGNGHRGLRALIAASGPGTPMVVCSRGTWPAEDRPAFAEVAVRLPDAPQRRQLWTRALGGAPAVDEVSAVFRLGPGAIIAAADAARRAAGAAGATPADLIAGARRHGSDALAGEAQRVDATFAWADLVLPADRLDQLAALRDRLRHRDLVHDRWGFAARLGAARGVAALFTGPSGTGKTMAAGVVADALGLELYRVDLAAVVSKYIGETEKNLARVFAAAGSANVVLFFDEADALFGKRTEVRDAHDRYANLEVAYLLQQIESFDGLVVLATNLRKNVDEAFLRRLQFVIEFPMPDAEHRRRLWRHIWPPAAPLDPVLDVDALADRYELSGGSIRNVAVDAAFAAAAAGCAIGPEQLEAALRNEHRKLGRVTSDVPARVLVGSGR